MPDNMQAFFDLMTELWNTNNPSLVPQLYGAGAQRFIPGYPEPISGPQAIGSYISSIHTGFPDFKIEITNRVVQGNIAASEWTVTGTHTGAFQNIPPTGKHCTISGVTVNEIENGKVKTERVYFDQLTLLQQLGVIPTPEQASTKSAS